MDRKQQMLKWLDKNFSKFGSHHDMLDAAHGAFGEDMYTHNEALVDRYKWNVAMAEAELTSNQWSNQEN